MLLHLLKKVYKNKLLLRMELELELKMFIIYGKEMLVTFEIINDSDYRDYKVRFEDEIFIKGKEVLIIITI